MNRDNVTHLIGGLSAGMLVGLLVGGYALTEGKSMSQVRYDYAACRTIAGDLGDGPMDDWKVISRTPEGRWCVR